MLLRLCALLLALPFSCGAATIAVEVKNAAGEPVPDAAVYALPKGGAAPQRPRKDVEIEQAKLQFSPLVTIVQRGTTVRFPNRDTVRHHVYSFSPAKSF